jgi:hypothetical protein
VTVFKKDNGGELRVHRPSMRKTPTSARLWMSLTTPDARPFDDTAPDSPKYRVMVGYLEVDCEKQSVRDLGGKYYANPGDAAAIKESTASGSWNLVDPMDPLYGIVKMACEPAKPGA